MQLSTTLCKYYVQAAERRFLKLDGLGGGLTVLGGPLLEVDRDIITANAQKVVDKCGDSGINVLGVTKGFSAIPQIVNAMLHGGVQGLADSRLENIIALRKNGFTDDITLLRIPRLSKTSAVVANANVSVNSEIIVIKALAEVAQTRNTVHQIILMVDVGDLREGVMPENVIETTRAISCIKGIRLLGLGTNMGCFGGVLPTVYNLGLLKELSQDIEDKLGISIQVVSGGGTSTLLMVENGTVPPGINQLRIGEGILLGTDTTNNRRIPWLRQDAFVLKAEVIEVKAKPSIPMGRIGLDAFGNMPAFEDRGIRKRAIIALGKQDLAPEGMVPVDPGLSVLGASSDHMIIDIEDAQQTIKVGSVLLFSPTYPGLLSLCNSKYVRKIFKGETGWLSLSRKLNPG